MRGKAQMEQVSLAQLLPLRETIFHTVEPRYNEGQGLAKCICSNEVSLYRGSFPYFAIRGVKKIVHYTKDFVI